MGVLDAVLKGKINKSMLKSIDDIPTGDLEKIIARRYKAGAPQKQIDMLENAYAKRVTPEENLKFTDMEPEPSEGISVEEQLANMFGRLKNPALRGGMDESGILANMRTAVQNAGGTYNLTDKNLVAAAEDVYNYQMKLRNRLKK